MAREVLTPWHAVPSEPHTHRCLSPRCNGRVWECTRPMCAQHVAYNHCQLCYPDGPMKAPGTVPLRWSTWADR